MTLQRAERKLGWGLAAPALLWTLAFFVVPFLAMFALSFAHREGRAIVRGFDTPELVNAPSHQQRRHQQPYRQTPPKQQIQKQIVAVGEHA